MFKIINESYPNILSVTDILIGDMSDINYEFLLVDKPIILISNAWLDKNFPDLGERISNVKHLHKTLLKIQNIDNFVKNRDFYKKKSFFYSQQHKFQRDFKKNYRVF